MKIILSVINSISAISLAAWPIAAYLTLYAFDTPGASSNPILILLLLTVLFYPVAIFKGVHGFWKLRHSHDLPGQVKYTLIGLISPLIIAILMLALKLICDGQFVCR